MLSTNTDGEDKTMVGATYQKILIRLMLRSCQICDVSHDFRADPRNFRLIYSEGVLD